MKNIPAPNRNKNPKTQAAIFNAKINVTPNGIKIKPIANETKIKPKTALKNFIVAPCEEVKAAA